MAIKLICEFAKPNEQTFATSPIRIGRLPSASFCIDHPDVGKMQAVIERENDTYYIFDLTATNPTKLNDHTVSRAKLSGGDLLKFGRVVVSVYTDVSDEELVDHRRQTATAGLKQAAAKLEKETVVVTAGGGLVRLEFNGLLAIRSIHIDDLVVGDREMLQDLLFAALADVPPKMYAIIGKIAIEV
jgi:DNA-binding protein YbaB